MSGGIAFAGKARKRHRTVPGRCLLVLMVTMAPYGLRAQDTAADPPQQTIAPSQVLTLDQDRLFLGSAYGIRVMGEIEKASRALAAENRAIEAQLIAEERDLTDRRGSMQPAEFRALADAFDAKVVEIRRVQDEKQVALSGRRDVERKAFYQVVAPVLGDMVREAGAVVILDSRAVFLSADRIDVTDEAIIRIDRLLGEGPIVPQDTVPPETTAP